VTIYFINDSRLARAILLPVLLFVSGHCFSQRNLSGKPGYLNVPSAAATEDGLLCIGYNYNPKYYALRFGGNTSEQILFANLALLPKLDVTFALLQARENGERMKSQALGDRFFDIRWRVIDERKYFPAVALVSTNPFTIDAAMVTQTIVATKHINLKKHFSIELTLGYGSDYYPSRDVLNKNNKNIFQSFYLQKKSEDKFENDGYLVGTIGGFKLGYKNRMGLMGEWDGIKWNSGAYVQLFKHLNLQTGLINGDQWMFGASIQGNLNPKTKP
jgi:hypothetical protein